MIGPGNPSDPIEWIDVRDLAEWIVKCAENQTMGAFIATGPKWPGTIGEVIDASIAAAKSEAVKPSDVSKPATPPAAIDTIVTWIPASFLVAQGVSPGGDLPIWIPPEGEATGFHRWNVSKAVAAGLTFRPLDDTLREIFHWYDALKPEQQQRFRAGLTREREAEVLKAWKDRKPA
ncbi:MAG: hypothetical protein SGJ09_09075 [Phycisphaerae bacterium]|nr:hypothetical protein [Phycisphaerae bacterium]